MTIWTMLIILSWIGLLLGFSAAKQAGDYRAPNGPAASLGQHTLSSYDEGLFTRVEDLSALSDDQFSVLQHPAFPRHQVRMKKSHFCDGTVNTYTGYIDVEARHLFFWFFESRSNPDTDDIIYWTNGGPGGSSSIGLFMELGPCRILSDDGPKFHPESWNSNANLLAVEQPIGVGFSYADYGEAVQTTEEAAKDIAAFLAIFFQHFTKFKGRPLHMTGESHGGIYIPTFAAEVYDQNARLVKLGMTPVNLTSIAIGNGMTDASIQLPYYYDMACTRSGGLSPVVDIKSCVRMKQAVPRCKKWIKESCVDAFDMMNCGAAISFCETELVGPVTMTGLSKYNLKERCEEGYIPCYPQADYIAKHLNLPSTRELIGIDANFTGNMTLASYEVSEAFALQLDSYRNKASHVGALLERGIRTLIYVGTNDFICNWLGNNAWVNELEWSGQQEMLDSETKPWIVDGQQAGMVRSASGLAFITVYGAGHMVPYDKPHEALQLINDWLAHKVM